MRSFERALYDAFSDSAELHRTIWELQRQGFQIRLSIACEPGAPQPVAARPSPSPASGSDVAFRIDSDDLGFLRSIGIDPTRARRGRRKP